jgi:hypothetical protein
MAVVHPQQENEGFLKKNTVVIRREVILLFSCNESEDTDVQGLIEYLEVMDLLCYLGTHFQILQRLFTLT